MKEDRSSPVMTFKIDNFQVSCSLHDNRLKLQVTSIGKNCQATRIICQKMICSQDGIEMSFIGFNEKRQTYSIKEQRKQIQKPNYLVNSAQLKRQQINSYLKTKLNSTKSDKKQLSNQQIFTGNAKLQLLNEMLQQKILQKEKIFFQNQVKLYEREELIKQLADKLIIANQQKEEIFNEYEKILQTTVFCHQQQAEMEINDGKSKNLKKIENEQQKDLQELIRKELLSRREDNIQNKPQIDNSITVILQNL